MKFKVPFTLVLLMGSLMAFSVSHADEDRRHDDRESIPRPAAPKFQAHPAGIHPHGPMVRPHAVRVLAPRMVVYGAHTWTRWPHPEFARPAYYWNWGIVHSVSCISEDSYGDQYPVSESTFAGFGLANMTVVEDDSLDRCYSESRGDTSCFLLTCSHF
jgi:hypothetical protein